MFCREGLECTLYILMWLLIDGRCEAVTRADPVSEPEKRKFTFYSLESSSRCLIADVRSFLLFTIHIGSDE